MSYLIDALKKAERERRESQRPDLQSASAADGLARGRPLQVLVIGVLAVLLIVNGALIYRLWSAQPRADGHSSQTGNVLSEDTPPKEFSAASAEPSMPVEQPSRALETLRLSDGAPPALKGASDTASAPRPPSVDSSAAGNGSVRYSREPLDAGDGDGDDINTSTDAAETSTDNKEEQGGLDDMSAEEPAENLPDQSQVAGAPDVEINGQLYSSVPGRSFILVAGRRFHEGERLPQGPAIESITPTGATLRYRGKRYHVTGP